jgi:TonB family protein
MSQPVSWPLVSEPIQTPSFLREFSIATRSSFGAVRSVRMPLILSTGTRTTVGDRRHLERLIDRSPKLIARTPLVADFVPTLTRIRRPAIEIFYSRVRKPKPLEVEVFVTDEQDEYDRLAKPLPGKPLPRYPAGIYFRGRGGVCEIEVLVSNFGHVTRLRLIRSSGNEWLDRSGMSAVSQWRFTPAIQNGKAQASLVNVPVAFSVNTN